jgi:hypothetical protein
VGPSPKSWGLPSESRGGVSGDCEPAACQTTVEQWLPLARGNPTCVDHLISFLEALGPVDQARFGLPWVANLVLANPGRVANRTFLLSSWLIEVRPAASDAGLLPDWKRVVDALVVARHHAARALLGVAIAKLQAVTGVPEPAKGPSPNDDRRASGEAPLNAGWSLLWRLAARVALPHASATDRRIGCKLTGTVSAHEWSRRRYAMRTEPPLGDVSIAYVPVDAAVSSAATSTIRRAQCRGSMNGRCGYSTSRC